MSYDSLLYVLLFLPVCLAVYQLAPKRLAQAGAAGMRLCVFLSVSAESCSVYLLATTLLVHCIGIWLAWLKSEEKAAAAKVSGSERKAVKAAYQKAEQTGGFCLELCFCWVCWRI